MSEVNFCDHTVREFLNNDGESLASVVYRVRAGKYTGDFNEENFYLSGSLTIFDGDNQTCFGAHVNDKEELEREIIELENLQNHINRFVTQLKLASESLPEQVARDS